MVKKNIVVFLIMISILLIYIFFNLSNTKNIESFSFSNKGNISVDILNEYYSSSLEKKEIAKESIIKTCLYNSGYDKWREYIEYIDIKIYKSKVIPNTKENLVIAVNLSKDLSFICIMNKVSDEYVFYKDIKNLLPINDIRFTKIPNKNFNLIIAHEILDERLGIYSYEEFLDIYMHKKKSFKNLLKETIFLEEIYKKEWIEKNNPSDQWEKIVVKNNIDFIMKDTLEILVTGTNNKYIGYSQKNIPRDNIFKLINSDNYTYAYYWNREHENFRLFDKPLNILNTFSLVIKYSRYDPKYMMNHKNIKF